MQIAMVGSGYVGLVTGTCFAEIGHNVIGIDTNTDKIKRLQDGVSPIYEPGIEDMMKRNMIRGRLRFSDNLERSIKDADVVFIAVGTPEGEDGAADLRYVKSVARDIGKFATKNLLVVVKSTVPVGSCDLVSNLIDEELQKRSDTQSLTIRVASNPEFLKEGDAINDFMRPDRIVAGTSDPEDAATFQRMYKPFIMDDPSKLLIMDRRSSELTKYGANAMLATRISFMNELSQLCESMGADIESIRRGMGSDSRIGKKFLYAGPGYGGSCFPKDVQALLKMGAQNKIEFSVLKAVTTVNDAQKRRAATKIHHYFGDLRGKTVTVWGLAFKPGTDDVREAPSKTIIDALLGWGATIKAHDPQAIESFAKDLGQKPGLTYVHDAYEALQGSDALVLITEWSEYRRPDWQKISSMMRHKAVFDLRNQYEPSLVMELGFHYQCIGRPDSVMQKSNHSRHD